MLGISTATTVTSTTTTSTTAVVVRRSRIYEDVNMHATAMKKSFARMVDMYFETRKNKRYGRDSMEYEMSWVANLVRDYRRRLDRTFRIDRNYTFLVSVPKWREIFATEFSGRLADHEVCSRIAGYTDRILSPRTYNNRKGMGGQAAINRLIEDINEVTRNYAEPAWIIKIDLKGYFPSALWNEAERQLKEIINRYVSGEEERSYLLWLAMVLIHANPAAHCERRTPHHMWHEHIEPRQDAVVIQLIQRTAEEPHRLQAADGAARHDSRRVVGGAGMERRQAMPRLPQGTRHQRQTEQEVSLKNKTT